MSEIFRQRNASRIVGVSIVIMLLLVIGSLLILLQKNEVFSTRAVYYLEGEQAQLRGLRKSMDVRILGEPVGTVADIAYVGSSNKVQLTLKIKVNEDPRKNVIWENSRIVVARSFGIGERYLEIERGTDTLGAIVETTSEREFAMMKAKGINERGVRVVRSVSGSPAEKAGLKAGEVITQFNDTPINGIADLYEAMSRIAPGDLIKLRTDSRAEQLAIKAELVEPKRLAEGGKIIQFQPEKETLQLLVDKIGSVQESIASVEKDVNQTLKKTRDDIDSDAKPAIDQIKITGKSVQQTSDKVRNETLTRVANTLMGIDSTSSAFKTQVESISTKINAVADTKISPAFDKFSEAATKLGKTSDSLTKTSDQIGKDAGTMIKELQTAATKLNELLEQSRTIITVLESEARDLPGTVRGINQTVDKADTVIDGVGNHWLVRRSVNKTKEEKGQPIRQPEKTGPIRKLMSKLK